MVKQAKWLSEREQQVWRDYLAMNQCLMAAIARQLGESGLSVADYDVLAPLSEAPEGCLRPRELGGAVDWDRSRMSHHLRRMEQRGLVSRHECTEDARGTVVRLTDAGRKALKDAAPGHAAYVHAHFTSLLTRDEADLLSALSERVLARLHDTAEAAQV